MISTAIVNEFRIAAYSRSPTLVVQLVLAPGRSLLRLAGEGVLTAAVPKPEAAASSIESAATVIVTESRRVNN